MILKGSQRGGGVQLAAHLYRLDDNQHVEVHQIRGFVADDLFGALKEVQAISRGTKCKQYLFSLSLNPPDQENVQVSVFEKAIEEIELTMGLIGQPRVIVFHEKFGRRHAHCVWSRISAEEMKAVKLSHFKFKLREHSRQLYIENGWHMPPGLVNSAERNPFSFSREEWQQAKRVGRNPKAIREIFQDCWPTSDSLKTFQDAMQARGFYLAQGDRRGFVAVDWQGEVYAIAKWAGIRTKVVSAKLGDRRQLPSVSTVQSSLAERIDDKFRHFAKEVRQEFHASTYGLEEKHKKLIESHRAQRSVFDQAQRSRWILEEQARAARFRKGLKGLWDWVNGRRRAIQQQNEIGIAAAKTRDDRERSDLVFKQLAESRALHDQVRAQQERFERELFTFDKEYNAEVAKQEAEKFEWLVNTTSDKKYVRQHLADRRRKYNGVEPFPLRRLL